MFFLSFLLHAVCALAVVRDAASGRASLHKTVEPDTRLGLHQDDETILLQLSMNVALNPGLNHSGGSTPTIGLNHSLANRGRHDIPTNSALELRAQPGSTVSQGVVKAIHHKVRTQSNGTLAERTIGIFTELLQPPLEGKKSKVVLALMEIFCPLGILGFDRLYLGNGGFAIAKFAVAVCTMGIGGFVWFTVDMLLIVWNGFTNQESINTFGMVAEFRSTTVEGGFYLSIVCLVSNMLVGFKILRPLLQRWRFKSASPSRRAPVPSVSKA
mmetsp:Transcript_136642/g.237591  ORF Transcript_136642/g.237591 Transcript_136642/m.237591 type:complete len:270 (+) Transcript_136642:59-868(+)